MRSNGDNRRPPTPTSTPPTNKSNDEQILNINKSTTPSDAQDPTQTSQPRAPRTKSSKQNKREEEDEEEQSMQWPAQMRGLPELPSLPIIQKGEGENQVAENTEEEMEEEEVFVSRDDARLNTSITEAELKEERTLVQKYQRRGMWDNVKAREMVDKALTDKRDQLRSRGRADLDTPESATARNQKYKLGDVTLSIEHVDDATLRRHKEQMHETAAKSQELNERKEEEVVADEDPEVIDALLDRPSRIDKRIAEMKGQEILDFDSQEELAEFEANKGKPSDKLMTRSRAQITEDSKRGPAITKNEHGADNISLLYDEEPPGDRAIARFNDPLKRLKFFPIYPEKIRKWVTYPHACRRECDEMMKNLLPSVGRAVGQIKHNGVVINLYRFTAWLFVLFIILISFDVFLYI